MRWLARIPGLPLLVKELVEQSARRRTYLVRVVYAALLFLAFGIFFRVSTERFIGNAMSAMGCGRDLFHFVVWIQIAGICLFLPAMMSGVLTYEKERRSLELLFLTDLGPWEILLQKYLGRLVPMFTYLLLSLPLMGVAYSLGGVTMEELAAGVYWLVVTCLGVGAFALMMSAGCRTSVQAFVATYGVGALLSVFMPVLAPFMLFFSRRTGPVLSVAGPMIGPGSVTRGASLEESVLMGIPTLIWTVVCLVLARVFLVSRASVRPRSITLKVFASIDRLMKDLNVLTGNIVLIKDRKTLPADEPIAWREMTKRALGKPRYLFRIFVAIEIPTLLVALGTLRLGNRGSSEGLTVVLFILWILAAVAISVPSANAIIAERTNRSLEV
ncbi:MAG: ABC transporter permease, partial [Planctomycetota bacterium]